MFLFKLPFNVQKKSILIGFLKDRFSQLILIMIPFPQRKFIHPVLFADMGRESHARLFYYKT